MSLKDWIIQNLREYGSLYIRYTHGMYELMDEAEYDKAVATLGEKHLYTCFINKDNFTHYILWNKHVHCIIKVIQDYETSSMIGDFDRFLYTWILGQPAWVEYIEDKYPTLLKDCHGCNCYNDMLITGWCSGKVEGVEIKRTL